MKIKTSELTGPALRYTVAQILGHQSRCAWMVKEGWREWQSYEAAWGNPIPAYDEDWSQGGPIKTAARIGTLPNKDGNGWEVGIAWEFFESESFAYHRSNGETELIAAMRCFVASKRGDEVDVPEELLAP